MEVMANMDTALNATLFAPSEGGGDGQAEKSAPESPATTDGGDKAAPAQPGTEKPETTTAKATDPARSAVEESADLPDEYKPFQTMIKAKGLDVKAKDALVKALGLYSEAESGLTRANQDKSFLTSRQTELQKRMMGDPTSINEWRKANKLPELPIAKSFADQAKEKSELFNHVNNVFTQQDPNGESLKWLNAHFGDLQDLRVKAAVEAERKQASPENPLHELRATGDSNFRQFASQVKDADELFGERIMPLFAPNGLLGSYGLDIAHAALSQEHLKAWEKIGRALKLADNYDAAVKEGIEKGVEAAMEAKRKAGNAGSIGRDSKQSSAAPADFNTALWAARHR